VITIAIIDDHPVARWGLEHLFTDHEEIRIAASVAAPDQLDDDTSFDVIVLDLYLRSDTPAIPAIQTLAARCPVLVLSASGRQPDVIAALKAGAAGYLTKEADDEEMEHALHTVAKGGFYLSEAVANFIQADLNQHVAERPTLTPRETQVLSYIARGFTQSQAATRMNIRPTTVNHYVERIRRKLGLGNKAELTRMAIELNLVEDPPS
jgi:DNA-binding NarL/FixJ family response regulator